VAFSSKAAALVCTFAVLKDFKDKFRFLRTFKNIQIFKRILRTSGRPAKYYCPVPTCPC